MVDLGTAPLKWSNRTADARLVRVSDEPSSWVVRNATERTRFREIHARMVPVNARVLALVLVGIALALPTAPSAAPLLAAILGIGVFGIVQRLGMRMPRPELFVLAGLLGAVTMTILAVALYRSARSPAMLLAAWTVAGITGRFNDRVAWASVAYVSLAMEAAIILPDPSVLRTAPLDVTLPPIALIAVWSACAVQRDSDIASRGAAIVDQLTGLLNRAALEGRIDELRHQSRVTHQPVALVVLDLDHFKAVNDAHGHARGDAVLRDVAYRVRHELGAHDLAYRLGGEEFAVLLPARDVAGAAAVAERLRAAISSEPVAGLSVRGSFGVAATDPGAPFTWDELFARADAALYAAKAAGRDRVIAGSGDLLAEQPRLAA